MSAPWSPDDIARRALALASALEGFECASLQPGVLELQLAPEHFDALVAAGGHVDRYDGWTDVRLEQEVEQADTMLLVLLHCERTS